MHATHLRANRIEGFLRAIALRRVSHNVVVAKAASSGLFKASVSLLFDGRKALENRLPVEGFTIAGVTFDGRQDLIRQLKQDQIVYLEREPWNHHDLLAVRVLDLSGRVLGYIPRRNGQNARFTYEGTFGLIASAGPVKDSSVYGARLYARPKLASFLLDPLVLPSTEGAQLADPQTLFGERWPAIRAATLAAAGYRCEVTGVSQEQLPIELKPQWCYNLQEKTVQMTRLIALCTPVAAAKSRMEQVIAEAADKDNMTAAGVLKKLQATPDGQIFTEINGLGDDDVVQYLQFVWRRACTTRAEQWRVDVLL